MKAHFAETAVIRAAVIDGDISKAVGPAAALADMEGVDKLPVDYRRSIKELKLASNRIGKSSDVPETAAATADIGVACGGCHVRIGGPKAELGEPPPTGDTLAARMKRHAWATERLWEGLYVPSTKAWEAGAKALKDEEPFPKAALKPGGVHARSAAARFTKLTDRAGEKKTPRERAALYAALLETCSSCHQALRD